MEVQVSDSKKMTAFRLEESLLRRLDRYSDRLAKETGLPVNRADVVRLLLTRGLEEAEHEQSRKGR